MLYFVRQVELLMQVQQIKCIEDLFGNTNNYNWLINKRVSTIWISTKDEINIRKCLTKLTEEQQVKVMKQLIKWLGEHPYVSAQKVPEVCISLLTKMDTSNVLHTVTFSRIKSLRNSFRKFSSMRNKISPEKLNVPTSDSKRRSVTFNDELQIFSITN